MAQRATHNLFWRLIVAFGAGVGVPLLLALALGAMLKQPLLALFLGGSIGILAGTLLVVRITIRQLQALATAGSTNENPDVQASGRRIERSVEETVHRP
ncbi:MAG: hypothetical protein ACP5UQ_03115 [Anaerolineae bacterium]